MSWGIINGDERILPSTGNHELKIEAGKTYKFRLLLQPGEEPFSFFEHSADSDKTENGQTTHMFRTVVCPKNKLNPYAPCKLCDGQQIRRRVRNVANIWSYDTNEVKILKGGEDVWKPIGTLVKMGMDITTLDFAVTRTGTGRNDTSYSVVNLGPATVALPADINTRLYDIQKEYAPSTEAEQQAMVESLGMKWDSVIVPLPLQYPRTLQECLSHVIPNTKYKGQTMQQVWETNRGMIEFFAKSNRMSDEKAMAQAILVNLGGAMIQGVPRYVNGVIADNIAPQQPAQAPSAGNTQPAQPANPAVQQSVQPAGQDTRTAKIAEVNKLLQNNPKYIQGGYQMIMNAIKEASDGKKTSINEFTDAELDKLIAICK